MYENGIGVRVDLGKAIEYYQKGAVRNNPLCLYKIGKMWQTGSTYVDGGKADGMKAFEFYDKSMNANCKEAQWEIGLIYEHGGIFIGVKGEIFVNLVD